MFSPLIILQRTYLKIMPLFRSFGNSKIGRLKVQYGLDPEVVIRNLHGRIYGHIAERETLELFRIISFMMILRQGLNSHR